MANAKSVFDSGIEKGATCVSALTKLRHMSHQAEKGETRLTKLKKVIETLVTWQ